MTMNSHTQHIPIAVASLLLLQIFSASLAASSNDLIVQTRNGKVRGMLLSGGGGQVRAFLGIPYGKPPVGKLRFRAPEPVAGWGGVRDATQFPNTCYQLHDTAFPGFSGAEMWNPNTPVSEDCLHLNVWSPHLNHTQPPSSSLAPVLVWIYGGGFTSGTSSLSLYDGRFLSQSENVVVVSMNYRVGVLGFLSLPNSEVTRGNAGLLDQQLALRWVANNIAAFGGDPSKVTIFGESAGSASVGYQLLSPGSHGLFDRAIMQSGSPTAPWAYVSQREAWERAERLGKLLGCPLSSPGDLEVCLQKADLESLANQQFSVLTEPSLLGFPFGPTVDGVFLPDKPEVLLRTGNFIKTEVLFGLNKNEGTYFLVYGAPGFDLTSQSLISRKHYLEGMELVMPGASNITREAVVFQYTDWTDENNGMKNRDSLGSLVGDQYFSCPLLEFALRAEPLINLAGREQTSSELQMVFPQLFSTVVDQTRVPRGADEAKFSRHRTHWYSEKGGKSRLFLFDHRSSTNPWPEWMGVMHGYEIEFIFGMPLNRTLGYTEEEVAMSKKFMKHWANFARTGNPSIGEAQWPRFTLEQQEYVTLNSAPPVTERMMGAQQCQLWGNLVPKIQQASDDLLSCVHADGTVLCCSYGFLLVSLLFSLTL